MILLDLFCGAGGAAMGYAAAGFEVIGVDVDPQPDYPFEFIRRNAFDFTLTNYWDVIHASPPCQAYSAMSRTRPGVRWPDLVGRTRNMLNRWGGPWVMENVPGAPLRNPALVCGSAFYPYAIRRHRLFESSLKLQDSGCFHERQKNKIFPAANAKGVPSGVVVVNGGRSSSEMIAWAMGMKGFPRAAMRQAVPPSYTEFIGKQIMEQL
jgi:DNA (cytosine-5)-methyltransferase 1